MNPIIVAFGSRALTDENFPQARAQIRKGLEFIRSQSFFADAELHEGDCEGADKMFGEEWAALGGVVVTHPARWSICVRTCKPGHRKRRRDGSTYCPSAGFRRNKDMADLGAQLGIKAHLNNSRGTAMMAGLLEAAGVHVIDVLDLDLAKGVGLNVVDPYVQED